MCDGVCLSYACSYFCSVVRRVCKYRAQVPCACFSRYFRPMCLPYLGLGAVYCDMDAFVVAHAHGYDEEGIHMQSPPTSCRMTFWHWVQYTNKKGERVARRAHSLELQRVGARPTHLVRRCRYGDDSGRRKGLHLGCFVHFGAFAFYLFCRGVTLLTTAIRGKPRVCPAPCLPCLHRALGPCRRQWRWFEFA